MNALVKLFIVIADFIAGGLAILTINIIVDAYILYKESKKPSDRISPYLIHKLCVILVQAIIFAIMMKWWDLIVYQITSLGGAV